MQDPPESRESEPEPESEPKAEPESEPKAEPESEPKAEPESEPKAEPERESESEERESESEPEPKAESEPEPKAESEPESEPKAESEPDSRPGNRRPRPPRGGLGASLGLFLTPEQRAARGVYRAAREQLALARQTSLSVRTPEDAAFLLRKAIFQLMVAVLRVDGVQVNSFGECATQIRESDEYRQLFADVLDDLPFLDELIGSFDLVIDRRDQLGRRFPDLVRRLPKVQRRVGRHLTRRLKSAGVHPRRWQAVALAIVLVVGAAAWLLTRPAPPSSAPPEALGNPPAENILAEYPDRCFSGSYFGDVALSNLVATRRDCYLNFDWGWNAVQGLSGLPADRFSIRWQGILKVPKTDQYTFYLSSDDGSRLFLNRQIVIDHWSDHGFGEQASAAIPLDESQDYPIVVEYYDSRERAAIRLSWSSSTMAKQLLSGERVWSPPGAGVTQESAAIEADETKCFTAEYFAGVDFGELVQTHRDCAIDFDWGDQAVPAVANLPADRFSVRWTGTLRVPATDEYTFYLDSDDGSVLYLDNKAIVGDWGVHQRTERVSPPKKLTAGVDYAIRVEYFEAEGQAAVRLQWSSSKLERQTLLGRYVTPSSPRAAPSP